MAGHLHRQALHPGNPTGLLPGPFIYSLTSPLPGKGAVKWHLAAAKKKPSHLVVLHTPEGCLPLIPPINWLAGEEHFPMGELSWVSPTGKEPHSGSAWKAAEESRVQGEVFSHWGKFPEITAAYLTPFWSGWARKIEMKSWHGWELELQRLSTSQTPGPNNKGKPAWLRARLASLAANYTSFLIAILSAQLSHKGGRQEEQAEGSIPCTLLLAAVTKLLPAFYIRNWWSGGEQLTAAPPLHSPPSLQHRQKHLPTAPFPDSVAPFFGRHKSFSPSSAPGYAQGVKLEESMLMFSLLEESLLGNLTLVVPRLFFYEQPLFLVQEKKQGCLDSFVFYWENGSPSRSWMSVLSPYAIFCNKVVDFYRRHFPWAPKSTPTPFISSLVKTDILLMAQTDKERWRNTHCLPFL